MSVSIINESIFWWYCFLTGIAITVVYDFLRIIRRVIPHLYVVVAFEDIVYWIFVSATLFLLLYHKNNGTLRWFAVFGLFIGMLFYKKIFGDFLVNFMSTILSRTLHLVVCVTKPPLNLVKTTFFKGFKGLMRCQRKVKNKLTGDIKEVKIVLCKHKNKKKRDYHESDEAS